MVTLRIHETQWFFNTYSHFLSTKSAEDSTIDGLMRHLRDNGISISGSKQKHQLINTGYFHGYKGYRFFNTANSRIPYQDYSDIYATIKYDSDLKSLFYGKIMYIETAVKNIALERIMRDANSENIQDIFKTVVENYNSFPAGTPTEVRKKAQMNKLKLENSIQSAILKAYAQGNPKVTHFYNNMGYNDVPLWAVFEILTLGDFAYLLSCLTFNTRDNISSDLGMNIAAVDTDRELVYKYLYTLKDLRNAVAHNAVVFDTRFKRIDPTKAMKQCLRFEFNLPYINFKTIGDYLILLCYYLKILKVSTTEIKTFIRDFEKLTDNYRKSVDTQVAAAVIHPDLASRITLLKNCF